MIERTMIERMGRRGGPKRKRMVYATKFFSNKTKAGKYASIFFIFPRRAKKSLTARRPSGFLRSSVIN
jgi:hypothetical protein